jgi:hypothetical protein
MSTETWRINPKVKISLDASIGDRYPFQSRLGGSFPTCCGAPCDQRATSFLGSI